MVLCHLPPVSIELAVSKTQQLSAQVEAGMREQKEEDEPQEVAWRL